MKHWYKNLEDRYKDFDKSIQILNLLSDINKAKNLAAFDKLGSRNHLYRSLILLDYIINDPKWKNSLKELLRLREVIGSYIVDQPMGDFKQLTDVVSVLNVDAYKVVRNVTSDE